jgi:hypothetical protein
MTSILGRLGAALADRIIARAQRTPYQHITGYMERFWLFRLGPREGEQGEFSPFAGRVHHLLRSDDDRHAHCHPWPYITIILRGGYYEEREYLVETPEDLRQWSRLASRVDGHCLRVGKVEKWHGPGSVLFRRSTDRHRLRLPERIKAAGGTWTLFITGPKRKSWFFHTEDGPIGHRDYTAWKARRAS